MFGETLTSTDTITHGLLHYFCCAGWIFEVRYRSSSCKETLD